MADTNFVEVNPSTANTEADSAYQADAFVTGGAVTNSFWDSPTANKFFVQVSRMVAALAQMMVGKGFSPVDGTSPFQAGGSPSTPVINLATILANILTTADIVVSYSIASNGYIKFGPYFGGLVLQWGEVGPTSSGSTVVTASGSFPTAWPTGMFFQFLVPIFSGNNVVVTLDTSAHNTTTFTVRGTAAASVASAFNVAWFAIGN
jgi:hypothetical protein